MTKADIKRITPEEAHRRIDSGQAMLVCAYESEEKCQAMHVDGAVSLHYLLDRLPVIPPEQEIIFYCG